MLDLVKPETEQIEASFLEPACGSGNFLVPILRRKLATVREKYGKSEFELRHYALRAVMSIYGIELLDDNIGECRANLLEVLADDMGIEAGDVLYGAALYVLSRNVIHGDALKMRTHEDEHIVFAEWGYLGKGKFKRRDFRHLDLSEMAAVMGDTFFTLTGKEPPFVPVRDYPAMTMREIAAMACHGPEEAV